MDTPAPRLKLRLLICNPKSYGPKNITCKGSITNGTTPRTREDPYLPGVCSYECKTEAEWQRLTTGISKQISNQHSFHAYAHFVDPLLPPGPAGRVLCEAGGEYALPLPVEVAVAEVNTFQIVTEPEGEAVKIVSTSYGIQEPTEAARLSETLEAQNEGLVLGIEANIEMLPVRVQSPGGATFPPQDREAQQCEQDGTEKLKSSNDHGGNSEVPSSLRELPRDYPLRDGSQEGAGVELGQSSQESLIPVEPEEKPLYAAAWEKLEAPMRLKDLAAALEVDADKLKASLQDPLSTVELGHAGWVKRQA